jgi:hypothetical protein
VHPKGSSHLALISNIKLYLERRRDIARVIAATRQEAALRVGVLDNWGDFEAGLLRMTPKGSCRWDDVAFAPLGHCPHPDFILVLNKLPGNKDMTVKIASDRLWFASGEPPVPAYMPYQTGQGDHCSIICTDEAALRGPGSRTYFLEPPIVASWSVRRNLEQLLNQKAVEKTHCLSWVTSNAAFLEGHRRRLSFLEKLKTQVEFDLFGRGFSPLADKWDGIAPYRYSIAFENTAAPHYFTEKIMDCFVAHTLPFYFGAPDITNYFPAKSMVVIDPDDPKVFDRIREISTSDLCKERMPHILEAKELVLKKYNMFARLARHFKEAAKRPPLPVETITLKNVDPDWQRTVKS